MLGGGLTTKRGCMKKIKQVIKMNIKIILGFILGLIWSGGVVYATANGYLFDSDEVSYDNTSSGLESENVQDALDELYANSDAYLAGLNAAHPIGSIFMTVNSNYNTAAKVASALGGSWEAISQGRVLIGAGTNGTYTFTTDSTGGSTVAGNVNTASQTITNPLGEYTHKLVTNEIPSHTHGNKSLTGGFGFSDNIAVNCCNILDTSTGIVSRSTRGNHAQVTLNAGTHTAPTSNNYSYVSINASHEHSSVGFDYYHNNIQPYLVVYMYKRTS